MIPLVGGSSHKIGGRPMPQRSATLVARGAYPLAKTPIFLGDDLTIFEKADRWCNGSAVANASTDFYSAGVCATYYLANNQANPKWPKTQFFGLPFTGEKDTYLIQHVEKVIQTYIVACDKGQIPEYVMPADKTRVILHLTELLRGQFSENFIRVVMFNLERGVNGKIISPALLQPIKYSIRALKEGTTDHEQWMKELEAMRKKRDEKDPPLDEQLKKYALYGGIAIVGVAGLYALSTVTSIFKSFRGS